MNPVRHLARIVPCCLLAVLAPTSCDKARDVLADLTAKAEKSQAADGPGVIEIGAEEFDSFRLQNDKVVIVDYHAPWCGPCRQLAPLLDEIVAEHGGTVVVGKINVDDHSDLAVSEGVGGIPDVRIYRNGGMVDKLVGLPPPSELRQRIATQVEALRASAPAEGDTPVGEVVEKAPPIQPMTEDWLPPGIQKR